MEVSNHKKSVRRLVEVGDDLAEDLGLQHLRRSQSPVTSLRSATGFTPSLTTVTGGMQ
jgi:hypothetical protein